MTIQAGFEWPGGSHALARPLLEVRPRLRRIAWSREDIDGAIHTAQSATGVSEIEGVIRFESSPSELLAMLRDRRGEALTYWEVRGGIRFDFPSLLVDVGGGHDVGLDPDLARFSHGEYSATVRLRRLDGGSYDALLHPLTEWYLVDIGGGAAALSRDPTGALALVDDGTGNVELAAAGTSIVRLIDYEPSKMMVSLYEVD